MKLTPHFSLEEFVRSATAQAKGIDNSLNPTAKADQAVIRNLKTLSENILEPLRDHVCQPIVISSGYRCPALNNAVGGSKTSQHLTGEACDIHIPSIILGKQWMEWIMDNTTFDQLIWERNSAGVHWIHVSCKSTPDKNRHQVLRLSKA
ncbi:MAG: D-Ala-D-Ala carboxypeptidase family metallohydrolase [Prevotellaceae bacterium]|nr:D-Ala-D-Ala carboxypeptidase family metallohydrolase [Prevotellaceae bacterium]